MSLFSVECNNNHGDAILGVRFNYNLLSKPLPDTAKLRLRILAGLCLLVGIGQFAAGANTFFELTTPNIGAWWAALGVLVVSCCALAGNRKILCGAFVLMVRATSHISF